MRRAAAILCILWLASPAIAQDDTREQGEVLFEARPDRAEQERSPFLAPGFLPAGRPEAPHGDIYGRSAAEGDRFDFESSGPPGSRRGGERRLRSLFDDAD